MQSRNTFIQSRNTFIQSISTFIQSISKFIQSKNNAYNQEQIHCFVASGLTKKSGLKLDDDEILSVVKMDFSKLLRMIKTGKIQDSKTICAALTHDYTKLK